MDTTTSATLLERLHNGEDPLVWDEFFRRYWRLIFGLAKYHRCSDNTAEEMVQEVMLVVFQKQGEFRYDRAKGSFKNWLGAVVRNQISKRRRSPSERIRGRGGDSDRNIAAARADGNQPDSCMEMVFECSLLLAMLDIVRREVSPSAYQAFELLTIHGCSGNDVARSTGLTRNAAFQARKRVIQRLHKLGASYRRDGELSQKLKEAVRYCPAAKIERSVTKATENTFQSRQESVW